LATTPDMANHGPSVHTLDLSNSVVLATFSATKIFSMLKLQKIDEHQDFQQIETALHGLENNPKSVIAI
jgi:hypothetical protein